MSFHFKDRLTNNDDDSFCFNYPGLQEKEDEQERKKRSDAQDSSNKARYGSKITKTIITITIMFLRIESNVSKLET